MVCHKKIHVILDVDKKVVNIKLAAPLYKSDYLVARLLKWCSKIDFCHLRMQFIVNLSILENSYTHSDANYQHISLYLGAELGGDTTTIIFYDQQ